MLNIIGHKNIFLGVSAALVIAAVAAVAVFGLREGIDFKGGTLWQFGISEADTSGLEEALISPAGTKDIRLSSSETQGSFLARLPELSEEEHIRILAGLKEQYPSLQELSFQSIGPSVGKALRNRSLLAVVLVLLGISLYIAFAFRKVYRPISSWKYGWVTLITLAHDVVIPAGLLAVLGKYAGVEIDGNFVVALLVIMGFSVHDTIVVFDRIRENLLGDRGRSDFAGVVNTSINQTLARSINTSLTLILVLIALFVLGPISLHYFILTLLVVVTMGIYSSIFVASPLLLVWQRFSERR